MLLSVYKDSSGFWRWRLQTPGNYKTVGSSSEGYVRRREVVKNVHQVAGIRLPRRFDRPAVERYRIRHQLGIRFVIPVAIPE